MSKKRTSPIGSSWTDVREKIFDPAEITESDLRVSLIGEITNARQMQGLTQKQLEKMSGVRQPVIARLEKGSTDPQLSTILKVLAPLGKTLVIADLRRK
jgi:DNA-binding XRE family transcriptional regulator